jgi:YD repeat-containing protein
VTGLIERSRIELRSTRLTTGNFGFSYDATSRRTQMTRPNGLSSIYAYDNLSRATVSTTRGTAPAARRSPRGPQAITPMTPSTNLQV